MVSRQSCIRNIIAFIILPFIGFNNLCAQEILDINLSEGREPGHVIIDYILIGEESDNESYYVEIFANFPDSTRLLKEVSGDVGEYITPGHNLIDWDYEKEILYFEGAVQFTIQFDYMMKVINSSGLRRDKSHQVKLHDSVEFNDRNLYLYHKKMDSNLKLLFESSGDTVTFHIPKNVRKRNHYQLFIDNPDSTRVIYSNNFKIKRKIPHFLKVLPLLIAGVYFGYDWYADTTEDLPEPPINEIIE